MERKKEGNFFSLSLSSFSFSFFFSSEEKNSLKRAERELLMMNVFF